MRFHTASIERERPTPSSIVTLDKAAERITIECWPRHVDPTNGPGGQYADWPIRVARDDGDGRAPAGFLPAVRVLGLSDPVVELRTDAGDLVYVKRIVGREFTPPAFDTRSHVLRVGDPANDRWIERTVDPSEWGSGSFEFDFRG